MQRSPRPTSARAHQHKLRRAPEPHDAHEHAALHAVDERVLQEGRESVRRRGAPLHGLQLRQASRHPHQEDGGTPTTPAMTAGAATKAWNYGDVVALLGSTN